MQLRKPRRLRLSLLVHVSPVWYLVALVVDFERCRKVWVPDDSEAGGFWSPPPSHVRYGVEQILTHPFFLLADDMGGMKTAQAIISAQFLHDLGEIDRVVVIAPAAVRPKVWFDEDLGQLKEQVFEDKRNRVSEFHSKIRSWVRGPKTAPELKWIVTNYEFLRSEENLAALIPYCTLKTMLVLDESSSVRGYSSAQTDAIMRLRWQTNARKRPMLGHPRCGRVLMLNGTPVAESPLDLFAQGNILHPNILECAYVTHFKAKYAVQSQVMKQGKPLVYHNTPVLSVSGWSDEGIKDLQQRFAPYVLRREAKDLGIDFALPPVCLEVRLKSETWNHYRNMRDQMVAWLESGVATASTAAVKSMRLSQITSGFLGGVSDAGIDEAPVALDDDFFASLFGEIHSEPTPQALQHRPPQPQPVQEVGREKLDFALAWHQELLLRYPDLKLLTWCRFVPELRRYLREAHAAMPALEIGAACGSKAMDGALSQKAEREHALRLLHPKTAPKGAVLVGATQGTGAIGLNFTACRTVLDMSFDFSPWKKRQGDARVNRPGQTGPVSFFYLVAVGPKGQKTIDHHVILHRLGKMNINDLTTSAWVKLLREE